jgi:hypothetical protein
MGGGGGVLKSPYNYREYRTWSGRVSTWSDVDSMWSVRVSTWSVHITPTNNICRYVAVFT